MAKLKWATTTEWTRRKKTLSQDSQPRTSLLILTICTAWPKKTQASYRASVAPQQIQLHWVAPKNKKPAPSAKHQATKHMSKPTEPTKWKWSDTKSPRSSMKNSKNNTNMLISVCLTFCLRYKKKNILDNIVKIKCKRTYVMYVKRLSLEKKMIKDLQTLMTSQKKFIKKSKNKLYRESEQIRCRVKGHRINRG